MYFINDFHIHVKCYLYVFNEKLQFLTGFHENCFMNVLEQGKNYYLVYKFLAPCFIYFSITCHDFHSSVFFFFNKFPLS